MLSCCCKGRFRGDNAPVFGEENAADSGDAAGGIKGEEPKEGWKGKRNAELPGAADSEDNVFTGGLEAAKEEAFEGL